MSSPKRMDFSKYPRETVAKDETLFLEEDKSKALYVLLTGSFGIFRNDVQVATVDEPLSIIGEISALTGRRRNAAGSPAALALCRVSRARSGCSPPRTTGRTRPPARNVPTTPLSATQAMPGLRLGRGSSSAGETRTIRGVGWT